MPVTVLDHCMFKKRKLVSMKCDVILCLVLSLLIHSVNEALTMCRPSLVQTFVLACTTFMLMLCYWISEYVCIIFTEPPPIQDVARWVLVFTSWSWLMRKCFI